MATSTGFKDLEWMNDAPLYIDGPTINRFYDAVVMPEHDVGTSIVTLSESMLNEIRTKLGVEGEISVDSAGLIPGIPAFLNPLATY